MDVRAEPRALASQTRRLNVKVKPKQLQTAHQTAPQLSASQDREAASPLQGQLSHQHEIKENMFLDYNMEPRSETGNN